MIPSTEVRLQRTGVSSRWWLVAGLVATAIPSGCAGLRHDPACLGDDHCLERAATADPPKAGIVASQRCVEPIPCGAVAAPPGTYVNAWSDTMAGQADSQRVLITRNLWFAGGRELGPDGRERVAEIAESFAQRPQLVLIEEEPVSVTAGQTYADALRANGQLNLDRKTEVVAGLTRYGLANAEELVYFASDRGVGVRGIEAPNVFNSQYSGGLGGGRGGGLGGRGGGLGGGGLGGGGLGGGGGFGGGLGGGGFGGGGMF